MQENIKDQIKIGFGQIKCKPKEMSTRGPRNSVVYVRSTKRTTCIFWYREGQ